MGIGHIPFLPHLRTGWPSHPGSAAWLRQLPALSVLIPVLLPSVFQRAWSTVVKGTRVKLPVPLDRLPSLWHPQWCPSPLCSASQSCSIVQVCLLMFLKLGKPFLSLGLPFFLQYRILSHQCFTYLTHFMGGG